VRVRRRDEESDTDRRDERHQRRHRGPHAADEHQVDDEDERRELHRRREAHPDPAQPPRPPSDVGEHQGEQHDVDLSQVERRADRVEREQHRHQQRGHGRTRPHPDQVRGTPDDEHHQRDTRERPGQLEDRERKHRQRHEDESSERWIDERQVE
jgi:hypothetical protein